MDIILINSPLFREELSLQNEDSLPPIGLGYIATHLRNNGIDVELIDAVDREISLLALIEILNYIRPRFLGLNIFSTNYELVKELVESLTCKTHVIIGGLSTKELYKKIIYWKTSNPIDTVIGDGEQISLDIIQENLRENSFYEIQNRRVFKVDENSSYFLKDISDLTLNRNFFLNEPIKNHRPGLIEANIVSSRGCIYNCSFCAAARSLNKEFPVRERSESSIIKELNEIKLLYPKVNSIRILDDLFLKSRQNILKASNIFSKYDFGWRSMAHIRTFSQVKQSDILALKKSGCRELFIGIESGSPRILKSINKTYDIALIKNNLIKLFSANINVKGYFIYGFPGESEDDMTMTYNLARELKNLAENYGSDFRVSVFQYRPYHCTKIYDYLKRKNPEFELDQIAPNQILSNLTGRKQFNFHSGNYSKVCLETIHDYICKTINLNGKSGIFKYKSRFIRSNNKAQV